MIAFFKWLYSLFFKKTVDKQELFKYNEEAKQLEDKLQKQKESFPVNVEDKTLDKEIEYWKNENKKE